jgi:hypothetical protein
LGAGAGAGAASASMAARPKRSARTATCDMERLSRNASFAIAILIDAGTRRLSTSVIASGVVVVVVIVVFFYLVPVGWRWESPITRLVAGDGVTIGDNVIGVNTIFLFFFIFFYPDIFQ